MVLPIAAWIACVFAQYPNHTSRNPYRLLQAPPTLLNYRLYLRLTLGLFFNDIGPITTPLIALGGWAAAIGKERARPLVGWTISGLLFVLLFAPKFLDHDYYGLMALPAAAGWGAIGWRFAASILRCESGGRAWRVAVMVGLTAFIQSPWVMLGKFDTERQHGIVAGRLNQLCSPVGKVIVVEQRSGWPVVHYCGRLGWVEEYQELPPEWRAKFRSYRSLGAELLAVCFDLSVSTEARETYRPLLETLPLLDHQAGPWFRHNLPCEYDILSLRDVGNTGMDPLSTGPQASVATSPPGALVR
jgi:hypothetical protein